MKATFRDLTAEEALSPAAFRFLQYEADRLETECIKTRTELSALETRHELATTTCNDHRVKIAVLEGQVENLSQIKVLSDVALGVGAALLGAAPSYVSIPAVKIDAVIAMILGAVLVIGSIMARIRT